MDNTKIEQLTDSIHALLGEKLNVRGRTLEARFRRAGRLVPRRAREPIKVLIEAQTMARDPRLLMRLDAEHVSKAYEIAARELKEIDAASERARKRINLLALIALQFLIVAGVFVALMRWRGYL